jgi:ABC-2 type transport system permease protein
MEQIQKSFSVAYLPIREENKNYQMKLIIKIAKNELRNLFYSPVAWFLAIIFMIMCAYFYTSIVYPWSKATHMMLGNDPNLNYKLVGSVTAGIFLNSRGGFFSSVLPNLYLFVPLLTMGVISREVNNGTIKLLYSSPVTLRQIVLGKYLALMIYNLMLVVIVGIFVVSGFFDIKSIDYGPLFSATLGFYLLLCALTAIGFFMSSLTTYPIVSAVASFTALFILTSIGGLWQQYDFVRDLTWFLSINNRTEKMVIGLITTKDVIYYLIIICMFVGFTILKLRGGREAKPWYIKTVRYAAIIVSGLLVGYVSSRPRFTGYLDTTAGKVNTIHPRTQKILKELSDGALEVTLYTNLFSGGVEYGLPSGRNNYLDGMWEQYQQFKLDITFKYEYYYDYTAVADDSALYKRFPGKTLKQISGIMARAMQIDSSMFKSPEEMHKQIDLKPEDYQLIMKLKYKGREELLRVTEASDWGNFWTSEQNVNALLKRLLGAKMPRVCFISGELERNIYKSGEREYLAHTILKKKRSSLINIGFDVDTVNLTTQEIPADATMVVLADPKMNLNSTVQGKLKNYIDQGGNMLIAGEPGKQYVLNPLLQHLGVQLMNGQLVQPSYNDAPDKVSFFALPVYFDMAEESWSLYNKHVLSYKVPIDTLPLSMPGMVGISHVNDSGFTMSPIWMTMPGKAWIKMGRLVNDSVAPAFSPQEGDIRENSFPIIALLSRQRNNKEQRIVVSGDADFASNLRLIDDYVRSIYSWLDYNQFPIYTPVPFAKDNLMTLTPGGASAQKIVYVWVFPAILLISATVLLTRRKRK